MASTVVKKRNWAFIVYPESLPSDWLDFLTSTGLPFAISPLHDRDVNESTGEVKKAHYHCLVCYDGPTSFNVVKNLIEPLHGPIPQPIESIKGAYRYFTHQDNPEKFQYDSKDIHVGNGFDIASFADLTRSEVERYIKDIFRFIDEHRIYEYSDLIDMLGSSDDLSPLWSVAINHTILFSTYLKSRRCKTSPYNNGRFRNASVDMDIVSSLEVTARE